MITVDGRTVDCQGSIDGDVLKVSIDGYRSHATISHFDNKISLYRQNGVFNFTHVLPDCGDSSEDDNHGGLVAPMNGTIVSILVSAGDNVMKDQPLVIMEAMKMEHSIKAPHSGTIDAVYFKEGEMVDGGTALLAFVNEEQ